MNTYKAELPKPQSRFIVHFSLATAFVFMTSGVFLSGLAADMGAGDILIGYITAIPKICGVVMLFFSSLIEGVANKKRLTIWLTAISRLVTLCTVLIPLFPLGALAIPVFVVVVVTAFTLQAQTTVLVNNWMVAFIGGEKQGRYISLRQTASLAVTVVLSFTVGKIVDHAAQQYTGLLIVFGIACVVAIMEVWLLAQIPKALTAEGVRERYSLADMIKIPLKNKPFVLYVLYVSLFFFFLYISDSFTVLYMMKYLNLPYATITGLQMLISLPQILLLGLWGRLSDKHGHKFVLSSSIWLFLGESLFLALSSADNYLVTISAAFLFAAAANAGFAVAVFNRRYELMPANGRILHDNFYSAAIGVALILGPVLGGWMKDAIASSTLGNALAFGEIRILYLVSMAGILALQLGFMLYQKRKKESI